MSLFKQFKTDENKEVNGIEIKYGANDDNTVPTFNVRRMHSSNQQYAKAIKRETEPYRRQIELGTLDDMIARAISMRAFCTAVLIGWSHVQGEDGTDIPYSTPNAVALFNKLPDLYDDLVFQAQKVANFRLEDVEATAKN